MSRPANWGHDTLHGNVPTDHIPNQPGEWQIRGEDGKPIYIMFGCPLRPGEHCHVPIDGSRGWKWDGNTTEPTLTPSIHCLDTETYRKKYPEHADVNAAGCGWHGFITKGAIK